MTSLMDGDTGFATGYTIVTHGLICLVAPFLLPLLDSHSQLPFWTLSGQIALLVIRMVMLPIVLAWLVRGVMKSMGKTPHPPKKLTYLLWLSSLLFILGKSVSFVLKEGSEQVGLLIASFAVGLLACAIQFTLGSHLARRIGVEEVACRQSMGQEEYRPDALAMHHLHASARRSWYSGLYRLAELLPHLLYESPKPS